MNVTDGDRERANAVIGAVLADQLWLSSKNQTTRDHIATALAEERERERAVFLHYANEIEGCGVVMGSQVAFEIRQIAEETTE